MEGKTVKAIHKHVLTSAGKLHTVVVSWVGSDFHKTARMTVKRFYKNISIQPFSSEKEKKSK
jgi:hypothetical protein